MSALILVHLMVTADLLSVTGSLHVGYSFQSGGERQFSFPDGWSLSFLFPATWPQTAPCFVDLLSGRHSGFPVPTSHEDMTLETILSVSLSSGKAS